MGMIICETMGVAPGAAIPRSGEEITKRMPGRVLESHSDV